jgi:hypothetical protein
VTTYLVDLVTPPRGTVCHSDHLPFDPDFGQPVQTPIDTADNPSSITNHRDACRGP